MRDGTFVQYDVSEHVAHVRLNRPAKLNAITHEMDVELHGIWKSVNDDPDVWCAILSGAGERAFCVGADIGQIDARETGEPVAFGGGLTGIGGPLLRLEKPLIAAVHGYCLGGGFELVMCADMIVAADDTRFGLPETAAGIIGHCGVVHRAVRRLPHAIAMAMVLSDERLDARSAERFGLVNAVVKAEELLRTALELASRVAACSPLANQAAKAAAICGLDESLTDALAARYPAIERYALTNDSKEAMQARSQGRRPKWSGC